MVDMQAALTQQQARAAAAAQQQQLLHRQQQQHAQGLMLATQPSSAMVRCTCRAPCLLESPLPPPHTRTLSPCKVVHFRAFQPAAVVLLLCCVVVFVLLQLVGGPSPPLFEEQIPDVLTIEYVKQVFVEAFAARKARRFTETMMAVRTSTD
jgi:hypothetical protein